MKNLKLTIGIILILFTSITIVSSISLFPNAIGILSTMITAGPPTSYATKTEIENYFQVPNGKFGQQVLNPLKQISYELYKSPKTNNINNFKTTITGGYNEFKDYKKEPSGLICQIGGNYLINVISKISHGTPLFVQTNLFSCKTTQDLINLIKIPNTWGQDEIIIYCNDGKKINYKENNFDFLTSKVSTYKACIIKNVDKDLTILAGLDVGNSLIDEGQENFYNKTTNRGSIINSKFEFQSNSQTTTIFKDLKDNLNYYFSYDNNNKFYSLRNFNDQLTTNINTIFSKDIGISRIALHKKLKNIQSNNPIIYGYETSISNKITEEKTNIYPAYEISYQNALIGMDDNKCSNYLQKYGAIDTGLFLTSTKIRCLGSKILINSNAIDSSRYGKKNGKVESFNLFKNIILGLN